MLGKKTTTLIQATIKNNDNKCKDDDDDKSSDRFFVKGIKIPGNASLSTCLHGGKEPQVGEVTRLGGVARLSI